MCKYLYRFYIERGRDGVLARKVCQLKVVSETPKTYEVELARGATKYMRVYKSGNVGCGRTNSSVVGVARRYPSYTSQYKHFNYEIILAECEPETAQAELYEIINKDRKEWIKQTYYFYELATKSEEPADDLSKIAWEEYEKREKSDIRKSKKNF